jgi:hypothetical protein
MAEKKYESTDKAGTDSRDSNYKHGFEDTRAVTETDAPGQDDVKTSGGKSYK